MDKEMINKIINAEPTSFTLEEIRIMMEEELNKDPSEMDTDFIDMCVEVLERAADECLKETEIKEGGKPKGITVRRVFMVAAVIIILFSFAIPVSAKYINSTISDKIVRFYADHFSIDLRSDEDKISIYPMDAETLSNQLNSYGFNNIVLPKSMMDYHYSKEIVIQQTDYSNEALVDFSNEELRMLGGITFRKTSDNKHYSIGNIIASKSFDRVENITVSGIEIVIYGNDDFLNMVYMVDEIEYLFDFNKCDFDEVVEIAKTLE